MAEFERRHKAKPEQSRRGESRGSPRVCPSKAEARPRKGVELQHPALWPLLALSVDA